HDAAPSRNWRGRRRVFRPLNQFRPPPFRKLDFVRRSRTRRYYTRACDRQENKSLSNEEGTWILGLVGAFRRDRGALHGEDRNCFAVLIVFYFGIAALRSAKSGGRLQVQSR